jgi:hypothetical protein
LWIVGGGQRAAKEEMPPPLFFVSVASKGLEPSVSALESTLMDTCASVDSKGTYVALKWCKKKRKGELG